MLRSIFRLKVQQIDRACLFELSWGRGQQLCATLSYPEALTKLYQEWQRAYLGFYKTALRSRVEASGSGATVERHAQLVQAEAMLLSEFHRWLRCQELFEIRTEIARAAKRLAEQVPVQSKLGGGCVDVFLTCNPIELERFPWEAWEIGTEFTGTVAIRFARTPVNIRAETTPQRQRFRRGRTRVLAILGDDTGLNFQGDRQALRSLVSVAEIQFVGWQPGKAISELKAQICEAIADERGWDILFFAGHSNETAITGGELAIAPGASMFVSEIAPQLQLAKERGLQFALFNSCRGLSMAASLIDLGLSQVAVMREPIHNRVAQAFLVRFLQLLTQYKDVCDALLAACQYLKQQQNLTYPSAYLIPSLFCHPDADLFQIEPFGFRQWLKQWLPTRREAIALGSLVLLSLFPPVQDFLLEGRVLIQAIYRDVTGQIPPAALPPVLLVQIDERSIQKAGISDPNPIDRSYLASLIDKLSALDAKVVGIDYLLDRPGNDRLLSQSIRTAVDRKGIWIVFAAQLDNGKEVGGAPETGIAKRYWSLEGYTNALPQYVRLLPAKTDCYQTCPFAYLLAVVYALNQDPFASDLPKPRLNNRSDFRTQVFNYLNEGDKPNDTVAFLRQTRLHPISSFAENFGQLWLRPINDFSIPPDLVYDRIAAWQLLDDNVDTLAGDRFEQQIAIVAPGGYDEAGIIPGADNFPAPLAVAYWRKRRVSAATNPDKFAGSEALAYMIHHLLAQRLVVPIPDLWAIGIAVLLGKRATLVLRKQYRDRWQWAIGLAGATAAYILIGLQVYISAAVLLPWFLPSVAFWIYVLPTLRRTSHG
ncbi:CHASE2 domain protein [Pleurocapsa sp. PCC 7327]|uniref:CHASE2 domain-containing protein n=1 Tax=Pleurocapsa sp. PCC 7327 TaxID=118163 RepID=UPI00029FCB96|nr:CHASE2 domain-containing protein [Pleurocapsa sp. PCC 7327]AFY78244.1 CHASE2 domain protein [Pleurocapsa sp. PCC 7327]